jgi:hypothetical protein
MGDAMTHRKLIACACSLLLTLCGIAVAQQQGIGWHFDMMRVSGSSKSLISPDKIGPMLIWFDSFDTSTTNSSVLADKSTNRINYYQGTQSKRGSISSASQFGMSGYTLDGDGSSSTWVASNNTFSAVTNLTIWQICVPASSSSKPSMAFFDKGSGAYNGFRYGIYRGFSLGEIVADDGIRTWVLGVAGSSHGAGIFYSNTNNMFMSWACLTTNSITTTKINRSRESATYANANAWTQVGITNTSPFCTILSYGTTYYSDLRLYAVGVFTRIMTTNEMLQVADWYGF